MIVCRSDRPIARGMKEKISLLCDVPIEAVVSAVDADSIYEVPLVLHDEGLDELADPTCSACPRPSPDLDRVAGAGRTGSRPRPSPVDDRRWSAST